MEKAIVDDVTLEKEKILVFEDGIIGFPDMKKFTLIIDGEKNDTNKIFWLQSLDDEGFAMPIVDPFAIFDDYNPTVNDEWFRKLGEHQEEDLLVFLTMVVPEDITKMTVNQKAPIVINTRTQKACQIIVEGDEYLIRCPVYDILKEKNKEAGE